VAPVEAAQRKDIAGDGTDACDRSEHRVWLVVDGFLMEVDDAAGIRKIVRHAALALRGIAFAVGPKHP
jgi:hypothetical protein